MNKTPFNLLIYFDNKEGSLLCGIRYGGFPESHEEATASAVVPRREGWPHPGRGADGAGFWGADRTLRQAKQQNRIKQALREVYAKLGVMCLLVS